MDKVYPRPFSVARHGDWPSPAFIAPFSVAEKNCDYGDFDAEAFNSTAVLVQGLRAFNVEAHSYIPHRIDEGHGLEDHRG